ncbi:MAG: AAA family ATPase [Phycisphaerae bacterium]
MAPAESHTWECAARIDSASTEFIQINRQSNTTTVPKRLILMRGLPSCGKSYTSRKLAAEGGVRIEFDEYFHTQVGNDSSSYDWSYELLPQARQWNLERIISAVDAGASPIIVDSDNVAGPLTRHYATYATDRGYEIGFKEPESPWWRAIRELLRDKGANAEALRTWARKLTVMSKSTHRVPLEDFLHRIDRWENVTVERVTMAA